VKRLHYRLCCQQLLLKYLCNLVRYWLQAAWGWHDSVETCRSVIICEIIVHLLAIVQNKKIHTQYHSPKPLKTSTTPTPVFQSQDVNTKRMKAASEKHCVISELLQTHVTKRSSWKRFDMCVRVWCTRGSVHSLETQRKEVAGNEESRPRQECDVISNSDETAAVGATAPAPAACNSGTRRSVSLTYYAVTHSLHRWSKSVHPMTTVQKTCKNILNSFNHLPLKRI
jgi:hypothetical protein